VCSGCKTPGVNLSACWRCKSACFCDQGCLKANWPAHKKQCGKQPLLGKAQGTAQRAEQEVAEAMRVFTIAAADEPEPELVKRGESGNLSMVDSAFVKQKAVDWHRRVCKLYKEWKSVKREQASRGDARDLILAFLAEAEIPVPADEKGPL
jgi:hypothetical protein